MFVPFISQQPTYINYNYRFDDFYPWKFRTKIQWIILYARMVELANTYLVRNSGGAYYVCTFSYILVCRYIFTIYIKNKKNFLPDFSALYVHSLVHIIGRSYTYTDSHLIQNRLWLLLGQQCANNNNNQKTINSPPFKRL